MFRWFFGLFTLLLISNSSLVCLVNASIPVINMSPERKIAIESHAVARSQAVFKVVAHALLSGGRVKRHAEWYASSAPEAAALLNALVFLGNEEADRAQVLNITQAHAGRHAGGRFRAPEAEADLLAKEELQPESLTHLNFSAAFVMAVAPTFGSHEPAAWANDKNSTASIGSDNRGSVSEEVEYALREHLLSRGLSVTRLKPLETRVIERLETPGSIDYRRHPSEPLSLVECASRTTAYSAAWLASKQLLLNVNFTPRASLEWHSHNLFIHIFYHQRRHERGTYGYSFKTTDYRDFFVNHLSHWDHRESEARQGVMAGLVERECERRNREPIWPHYRPTAHRVRGGDSTGADANGWRSVALVPFWGGSASESGGNSHSNAKRSIKVAQLAGTVCSALKAFRAAAVGVCSTQDRNDVLSVLTSKWGPRHWSVVYLRSISLPTSLPLRDASTLRANMKHLKLPTTTTINELASVLKQHPVEAAKLHNLFDLNDAVLVNGTSSILSSNTELLVLQFDCSVGVHLPFHLLQAAQALMLQPRASADVNQNNHSLKPTETSENATANVESNRKSTKKGKKMKEELPASTVIGCENVACGGGDVAPVTRGALRGASWHDMDYVYFSEADQVTFIKDAQVLSSMVAILNATNYVAPQRMTMNHGTSFLQLPGVNHLSIGEATQAFWQNTKNHKASHASKQISRLLIGSNHQSTPADFNNSTTNDATSDNIDKEARRRRLFMPRAGARLGKVSQMPSEMFAMENECEPNAGERGYLGPASVHVIHDSIPDDG